MNILNSTANNNYCHKPGLLPILIVDDEIDILSVIRRRLEEYGFNICSFTKPSVASEHYKISSNTHPIVISDLQMPNMNGIEFVRKVKEINFNAKVILMTCFEMDDSELLSSSPTTKLMIDEVIQKPFSVEKLIMLINKHIINRTKESVAIT